MELRFTSKKSLISCIKMFIEGGWKPSISLENIREALEDMEYISKYNIVIHAIKNANTIVVEFVKGNVVEFSISLMR